jgi:hypothetical protein
MGISEAASGRARAHEGGGLRLSDQGELPSCVPTGADRCRISRGNLVPLRHARRAGTHHSRTLDRGQAGEGVCICGELWGRSMTALEFANFELGHRPPLQFTPPAPPSGWSGAGSAPRQQSSCLSRPSIRGYLAGVSET